MPVRNFRYRYAYYKRFGNSTNDQYITIPAGQTVVLLSKDVTAPYIVDGKVSFVPTASNMKARIFI